MNEISSGADLDGFNPFPGVLNIPNDPCTPGDLAHWNPNEIDVRIALDYAQQVFAGTKDRTLLNLLAAHGIGAKV